IFDIAYLRSIPNLVIMAPQDAQELEAMLELALGLNKPVAIRYPRATAVVSVNPGAALKLGKAELIKAGTDFTILALGTMVAVANEAIEILSQENFSGGLINARFVHPLDLDLIKTVCAKTNFVFTLEEGIRDAGFGSAVVQELGQKIVRLGLPAEFIPHGARSLLLEKYGLTAQGVAASIRKVLKNNG
ncbi:MAG: transketolase C-terminal domain-containing protein, partial [Candidatus Omnitrophica bacterium]|nr:transketolase C-terminal domain-containing protein [Candidatus Omnitrophota bacterium]